MPQQEHIDLLTKSLDNYMQSFNKKVEIYTNRMHESRDRMMEDVQYEIDRLGKKTKGTVEADTTLKIPKAEFQDTIRNVTSMLLQISNLLRGLVESMDDSPENDKK